MAKYEISCDCLGDNGYCPGRKTGPTAAADEVHLELQRNLQCYPSNDSTMMQELKSQVLDDNDAVSIPGEHFRD